MTLFAFTFILVHEWDIEFLEKTITHKNLVRLRVTNHVVKNIIEDIKIIAEARMNQEVEHDVVEEDELNQG